MAGTTKTDMQIPSLWTKYVSERIIANNNLLNSGILTVNDTIKSKIENGGDLVNMPFFKTQVLKAESIVDGQALTSNKLTTGKDIAVVHSKGLLYEASVLSKAHSGADPLAEMVRRNAIDWGHTMQETLMSSLKGAFASASMADHIADNSAKVISNGALLETMALLGDHANELTSIAMHSAVYFKLLDLGLATRNPFDARNDPNMSYYLGKKIVIDDSLVDDGSGVYPVYLFGQGCISFCDRNEIAEADFDKDIATGSKYFATRRFYVMHPNGIAFTGTVAGDSASDTELETGTNWNRVVDSKNVAIALLKTKIA